MEHLFCFLKNFNNTDKWNLKKFIFQLPLSLVLFKTFILKGHANLFLISQNFPEKPG